MARSKKPDEPMISVLVMEKTILKERIREREEIGTEIVNRTITTPEENQQLWQDYLSWNKYNEELIKQAFNHPNNPYAEEYEYRAGISMGNFYGPRRQKTFAEIVESNKSVVRIQLRKLKWFFEKIDLLKVAESPVIAEDKRSGYKQLLNLLSRFHRIAQALRDRHSGRETILVNDEYDVQDLLNGLLQANFYDVRKEEASPSSAGANSRLDFVLKNEKLILEIKMTSERYSTKKLGEDLLVDIGRYKAYPDCTDLIIFIYDKGDYVRNKQGFIIDLEKQSTDRLKVTAIINPS